MHSTYLSSGRILLAFGHFNWAPSDAPAEKPNTSSQTSATETATDSDTSATSSGLAPELAPAACCCPRADEWRPEAGARLAASMSMIGLSAGSALGRSGQSAAGVSWPA